MTREILDSFHAEYKSFFVLESLKFDGQTNASFDRRMYVLAIYATLSNEQSVHAFVPRIPNSYTGCKNHRV